MKTNTERIDDLEKRKKPLLNNASGDFFIWIGTMVAISLVISYATIASKYGDIESEITNATINEIFERYGERGCVEWEKYDCPENITIFINSKLDNWGIEKMGEVDVGSDTRCFEILGDSDFGLVEAAMLNVHIYEDNKTGVPYYKLENTSHSICTRWIETTTLTREVENEN